MARPAVLVINERPDVFILRIYVVLISMRRSSDELISTAEAILSLVDKAHCILRGSHDIDSIILIKRVSLIFAICPFFLVFAVIPSI